MATEMQGIPLPLDRISDEALLREVDSRQLLLGQACIAASQGVELWVDTLPILSSDCMERNPQPGSYMAGGIAYRTDQARYADLHPWAKLPGYKMGAIEYNEYNNINFPPQIATLSMLSYPKTEIEMVEAAISLDCAVFSEQMALDGDELTRAADVFDYETRSQSFVLGVVSEEDGELAGYGSCLGGPDPRGACVLEREMPDWVSGYVNCLAVRPKDRGHDLARHMMDSLMSPPSSLGFMGVNPEAQVVTSAVRSNNLPSFISIIKSGECYRDRRYDIGSDTPGRSRFLALAFKEEFYGLNQDRLVMACDFGTFIADAMTEYLPEDIANPDDVPKRIQGKDPSIAVTVGYGTDTDEKFNSAAKALFAAGYAGTMCSKIPKGESGASNVVVFKAIHSFPKDTATRLHSLKTHLQNALDKED